jgi:hypothetical protein
MGEQKSKRDKLEEIKNLKTRKEFSTFWNFNDRLSEIESVFTDIKTVNHNVKQEFYKSVPVSVVATMESYFRSVFKSLIDSNNQCHKNTQKYFGDKFKISYEFFDNLNRQEISLGELVSHHLSFGNLDEIISSFCDILKENNNNFDFIKEIKLFVPEELMFPRNIWQSLEFNSRPDEVLASVAELFKIRNIICHEIGKDLKIDEDSIEKLYRDSSIFLHHCHAFFYNFLYPSTIKDLENLGKISEEKYQKIEKELQDFIEKIKKNGFNYFGIKVYYSDFNKSYMHWKSFRDSYLEAIYGNNIYPELKEDFYNHKRNMTEDWLEDMKVDFDFESYD